MAGAAEVRAGRAYVELFLKNSLTKGLAGAQKQLDAFSKSTIGLGSKMVAMGATAAIPIAYLTKTFMDFDDAMRLVGAVSQSTDAELKSLTATAKKLGASTSFTAIQVAGLMGELGKAGFTAKEVEKMTKAVLDLSRATGTDAVLSSGIMAATLRQFGMGASEATRAADALTVAANASFNSVESLGESLSYAGPVAADFGMSLEDTLAILGALGNVGIQGSNAGTAVRRLLTLGAAEADKLKGIFGVAFKDAAGNARPLVDVLDEVNKATAGLGTAKRAEKFNEAFGLLGITGASVIAKNAVSVRDLREQLSKADGVAAETAKKMDAGLGGAFRRMMSAIEGVQIAIGEALAPMFTRVAANIEFASTAIIEFVEKNREVAAIAVAVIAGITGIGAALIAIGLAAKVAAVGLGVVLFLWKALVVSVGLLASPFALIAIALVAGVALWVKYTETGKAALESLSQAFAPILSTAQQTFSGIQQAIKNGDLGGAGKIAMAGLLVAFEQSKLLALQIWIDLKNRMIAIWDEISIQAQGAFAYIGAVIMQFATDFRSMFSAIFIPLEAGFKAAATGFEALKVIVIAVMNGIIRAISNMVSALGTIAPAVAKTAMNALNTLVQINDNEAGSSSPAIKAARKAILGIKASGNVGLVEAMQTGQGVVNRVGGDARDKAIAEARARVDAANAARDANNNGALGGQQSAVDAAQEKLDALIAEQQARANEAKAVAVAAVNNAAGKAGENAAGAATPGKSTFGSFSAAALMAQGNGGGGVQGKILQEAKRGNKEVARKIDKQIKATEKLQMQMVG